ncbi:MAG: hypothetical protein H6767_02830 [Candidatus Peribacteria bacterium]|nr:MAG: hypothetical protein H6767_02830 [Candidatus Peribacteria bacterium]
MKLIISCNGDLYSHCQTRGVVKEVTLKLYENIQRIISAGIAYQINIVSTPDVVARLHKNFVFLHEKLGGKVFNFLPVNYNGWDDASLAILESELEQVWQDMQRGGKLQDIQFINGEVDNRVALFNAELVVDSDGRVYPSMVILEKFFLEEKENICIADMREDIEAFESKLSAFDTENFSVYDAYINKVLQKKFASIQQNDYRSSEIFHEFLERI